ncbi:helix-turn-helix domain-containing protein [Virgibacillus sp. 179-BFC.A HS]|uniref:Helix-turn-helix domain-containing protein n=1 Tax=Tigheibacillus jepli TaxID=3035914 RepID=A0ABU5CLT9_9BACI|nr:helix-turn-helix domain-containing protein [Virgibacillus sp. 179-BFC.A HS]MDY0406871.1 helix-turn-helix domain-containing protein [Virgibacillus sp. 179-BFC.A HS]
MSSDNISYYIKFFRERRGWSQQELADQLHISRAVVSKWETGTVKPGIVALEKLSNLFGVPIDHILGRHYLRDVLLEDYKQIYSTDGRDFDQEAALLLDYLMAHPSEKELLRRYLHLPGNKQEIVFETMKKLIEQLEKN